MGNSTGINVRVLGDYGPFSRVGKSIGYQVSIGDNSFLLDCGFPVFQKIGGHGLKNIKGLIITHCHDDHKRWFSDYALFNRYAPDFNRRFTLMTSESVNRGLMESSRSALCSSLSFDATRVVDISYEEYVDLKLIAPKPRYRIEDIYLGDGSYRVAVVDSSGNPVGPERAKVVINPRNQSRRLLFRDDAANEWIEPESYYPFSSSSFYEDSPYMYEDDGGFTVEAINAPVWHGVPTIGIKFCTGDETLIFSSDTNHDLDLWKRLCSEKLSPKIRLDTKEFLEAGVLVGNINDYIERVWGEERYRDAVAAFEGAAVIHDISLKNSVVHTDYNCLEKTSLDKSMTLLTHSPDKMTSEWILSEAEKLFRVRGSEIFEVVDGKEHPFSADYYHKEDGRYYVCYRSETSPYAIYDSEGILTLSCDSYRAGEGSFLCNVDIYEDVGGGYYPKIENDDSVYRLRPDGRVELLETTESGTRAELVENRRPFLSTGRHR